MVFVPVPGVLSLVHTQNTPSTTWSIEHNLNKTSLAVDAMVFIDGVLETAIPYNIFYPDANNVIIEWTVARTGRARLA